MRQLLKSFLIWIAVFACLLTAGCKVSNGKTGNPYVITTDEMGLCYRQDIKIEELGFLKEDPSKEEILNRLGYPYSSHQTLDEQYTYIYVYYLDDGKTKAPVRARLTIIFDKDYKLFTASILGYDSMNALELSYEPNPYEPAKYYAKIRNDITPEELSFIDKNTDSNTIQEKLGAPHKVSDLEFPRSPYAIPGYPLFCIPL